MISFFQSRIAFAGFAILFQLLGCTPLFRSEGAAVLPGKVTAQVDRLIADRPKVYGLIRALRGAATPGDSTDLLCKPKYETARGGVDSYLDRLSIDLETTADIDTLAYESLAAQASIGVADFLRCAEGYLGESQFSTAYNLSKAHFLVDLATAVLSALDKKAESDLKARSDEVTRLLKRLELARWKPFDDV